MHLSQPLRHAGLDLFDAADPARPSTDGEWVAVGVIEPSATPEGAFRLPVDGTWTDEHGRRLWIEGPAHHLHWTCRQVAPFLAWLRGIPVLHASATRVSDGAIGFFGESGAGKSTLAAAFAGRGHDPISDDLLTLRWRDHTPVVRAAPATPVTALFSLSRHAGPIEITALRGTRAVEELIHHGFGELALPAVRARQFATYLRLAQTVSVHRLRAPDDLTQLDDVIDAVAAAVTNPGAR